MFPKLKHSTLPQNYRDPLFQLAANYSPKGEHNTVPEPIEMSAAIYSNKRERGKQNINKKNLFGK